VCVVVVVVVCHCGHAGREFAGGPEWSTGSACAAGVCYKQHPKLVLSPPPA
jgi:hypothetical protein